MDAPSRWLANQHRQQCVRAADQLDECRARLKCEVIVPLNVSCSTVLRGTLARHGAGLHARGTANGVDFNAKSSFAQIETLNSALELAAFHLRRFDRPSAVAAIRSGEEACTVPPRSLRFPQSFTNLDQVGVCMEAFVCERTNVVFNVHTYMDTGPNQFRATETLSSKSIDLGLVEVWQSIDVFLAEV